MLEPRDVLDDWHRDLRHKLAWALIAKLPALALLWASFFQGTSE